MRKYRVAVVGATGMVGRMMLKVLEERNFPISDLFLFASGRSAGQKLTFQGKEYTVEELNENSFDRGIDFALFQPERVSVRNTHQLPQKKVALL